MNFMQRDKILSRIVVSYVARMCLSFGDGDICVSETSVIYNQTTQCYNTEDQSRLWIISNAINHLIVTLC
jgi:hypothetical protein